jgi:hypothetical protein
VAPRVAASDAVSSLGSPGSSPAWGPIGVREDYGGPFLMC